MPVADAERCATRSRRPGPGAIGDYDSASFTVEGEGRFRPLAGASPTIGTVGDLEEVAEVRIEVVAAALRRAEVVRALLAAHPYEEPAYDVVELADPGLASTGTGRVGTVEPTTLAAFAARVAEVLPADRARGPGRRRPRPPGAPGRGVRRRGRLPARHGARGPTPTST